ncbi:MAG: transposase [Rhodoferax sp.]|nr:transposase [Rhodoferax sp.]
MTVMTVGLDLAKNVFQVHGVDARGVAILRKQLRRDQVAVFFAKIEPCVVGLEACGGAHYWAGKLAALGHTVKMMSPQFVKLPCARKFGHCVVRAWGQLISDPANHRGEESTFRMSVPEANVRIPMRDRPQWAHNG